MWFYFIQMYWQVSLFKKSPADTPYSQPLLTCITGLFFLFVLVQWVIANFASKLQLQDMLIVGCLLLASYFFYTGLLLSLFHKKARLVQTLTCLFACHTMVHVVALPLLVMLPLLKELTAYPGLSFVLSLVYLILSLMLSIWQFMISTHIFKQALMIKTPAALLASLGLLAMTILMVSLW